MLTLFHLLKYATGRRKILISNIFPLIYSYDIIKHQLEGKVCLIITPRPVCRIWQYQSLDSLIQNHLWTPPTSSLSALTDLYPHISIHQSGTSLLSMWSTGSYHNTSQSASSWEVSVCKGVSDQAGYLSPSGYSYQQLDKKIWYPGLTNHWRWQSRDWSNCACFQENLP